MGKEYDVGGVDDELGGGDSSSPPSPEFDEDEEEDETNVTPGETTSSSTPDTSSKKTSSTTPSDDDGRTKDDLPHRVRHDSPKANRSAVTFFLSEDDQSRIRDRVDIAERTFDQRVYEIDVHLAVFRSDGSEDSFLEEMREIGYGYFD